MRKLYPLKFNTILKPKVWGGNKLVKEYSKALPECREGEEPIDSEHIGESWDLFDLGDSSSIVSNGFLTDNEIVDIIETYLGDLVGDAHYDYFGIKFPLIIKFLNIQDKISIQVHPDDTVAMDRYESFGKSEFWYVLEAEKDAKIYMGFKRDVTVQEFYDKCNDETVDELLNVYHPRKGDCFMIEPGTVHSAGGGIVLVEIQESSDLTFRLYDWGREHNPETAREMHLEEAIDCINYKKFDEKECFESEVLGNKMIADNKHFTVNNIDLKDTYHIYTDNFNSFIIYICTSGVANIQVSDTNGTDYYKIKKGETILIPASLDDFFISPEAGGTSLLEVYIRNEEEEDDEYIDSNVPEEPEEECHCGHHHKH